MEDGETQTSDKSTEKETKKQEEGINADNQEASDTVSLANVAAARLEAANKETERLLARQEKLKVQETLGGKAEAGTPPKEETPAEYATRVMENDIENS